VPLILISEQAKADLRAIESYIAAHDGEGRAAAFRSRLDRTMKNLAYIPGAGGRRPYLSRGQRAFPVPPWTIFYEELPEQKGTSIVRIVDGRRDLPRVLRKPR
jgi:plasmid stabilization system protein ParE